MARISFSFRQGTIPAGSTEERDVCVAKIKKKLKRNMRVVIWGIFFSPPLVSWQKRGTDHLVSM
jgi:hypothetical protein